MFVVNIGPRLLSLILSLVDTEIFGSAVDLALLMPEDALGMGELMTNLLQKRKRLQ